jgi:hypothetical protein
LSEAGDIDSARADEAAQAAKAGSALALDLVLALAVALAAVLVALLALAFAVARWWAGRARAFGLALVWATAAVEPGPWALSGPWNHLRALCILPSYRELSRSREQIKARDGDGVEAGAYGVAD